MFQFGRFPEYLREPAAWFYPRILVGPGQFLTPRFAAQMNITHVINCAFPVDCPEWFPQRHPTKYLCLNAVDALTVNILDWYPTFESKLHSFLRAGSGVVYVHCQAGMNRSGSLALAYVCKNFHLPLGDVVVATRRQRPVLFQNPVFMNQVKEFINGCLSRPQNSGLDVVRVHNGNSGLFAPDHRSGSQRLDVDAGELTDGAGAAASDGVGSLLQERSGLDREGEPVGSPSTSD